MRFAEAMASRTDAELVEVVTGPVDDWEPEAIDAAKAEIARRGLSLEPRPAASDVEPTAPSEASDGPPLETWQKILAFHLGLLMTVLGLLVALAIRATWARKGERRRGRELMTWTIVGALASPLLFALLR